MLRTIARPVIGVLLARVALGFDRVHRATAAEEEAATRLVRALQRVRREGKDMADAQREELRKSAEGFIDAVRVKGRQWPRRARRPAVVRASNAYREALVAADLESPPDQALAAVEAALAMLVHAYPDLACELTEAGASIAPDAVCVPLGEHRELPNDACESRSAVLATG